LLKKLKVLLKMSVYGFLSIRRRGKQTFQPTENAPGNNIFLRKLFSEKAII